MYFYSDCIFKCLNFFYLHAINYVSPSWEHETFKDFD
jgi:hypothetical protein